MNKVILQGGGEHARVVLDCLLDSKNTVLGLFDPKYKGESLFGIPQLGTYEEHLFPDAKAIVAIGDNAVRKKVVAITRHHFTKAVHHTATISTRAYIGLGTMILHRAIIQANASIGEHVIVNTAAQVDHDCKVGDYAHLGPGSILCGCVQVGEGTFIGAGAVVIPGIRIGKWCVIGAGAVVVRDIPDHSVAYGQPARVIKTLKT